MKKRLPLHLRDLVERLRREEGSLPLADGEPFATILELVEYLAANDHLVRARGVELEPDHLAYRLLQDPQLAGAAAVNSLLAELDDRDLHTIERLLLRLERRHGEARTVAPNHRTVLDAAVLGPMSFVYSRKYGEVLATRSVQKTDRRETLLADLLHGVDRLYPAGRPAYLWRLGPEFGTDCNVRHLLQRDDWFIARSLYRSRAGRQARDVVRWRELPGGEWVGEFTGDSGFEQPLRSIVLRWQSGRRQEHALLWTNLFNTSWEEVLRFYNNRSCKRVVDFSTPAQTSLRRRLSAAAVVLAIFTFRNLTTWASVTGSAASANPTIYLTESEDPADRVSAVVSAQQAQVYVRLGQVLNYLQEVTGESDEFTRVAAAAKPLSYKVAPATEGKSVAVVAPGQVIYVGAEGGADKGTTVVVSHGQGFVTVYGGLGAVNGEVSVGAHLGEDVTIGYLAPGDELHFEAGLAKKYLEKGLQPSVAEMLSPNALAFLDPLGLLNHYGAALEERGDLSRITPSGEVAGAPDLGDAELFQLLSPTLSGVSIFPAGAIRSGDFELEQMAQVFDDDVLSDVLGVEIS